ncbi:ABC transporter permease subunit [Ruminococcaceae bacterium OttesenSCG-928-L11]|nr:ABC transporter permease subunit [Ruminococcaceae bacterium OttesenSCG-928-L11]
MTGVKLSNKKLEKENKVHAIKKSIKNNWDLYLLLLLPVTYFLVFKYRPMAGLIIAFKNYKFNLGYWRSPWASAFGFGNFIRFFQNAYFSEIMWNTLSLSLLQLICSFPVPILLAVIMNELRSKSLKKGLQLITYAPHFISTVILVAIMEAMMNPNTGVFNALITACGGEAVYFFGKPEYFRPMYILSGIWQNSGYSSIIYLAALSNIDPQLIESARIDGANRLQIIRSITLPALIPTAVILLIMNSGKVMSVGFEKVYLMQNTMNVRASEVISTYVYKSGIESAQFSYSTAVGLFNSVINIVLLLIVNQVSKKLTETSLW